MKPDERLSKPTGFIEREHVSVMDLTLNNAELEGALAVLTTSRLRFNLFHSIVHSGNGLN